MAKHDNKACEICHYWHRLPSNEFHGQCKRYPPRIIEYDKTRIDPDDVLKCAFPITSRGSWCGEYLKKDKS